MGGYGMELRGRLEVTLFAQNNTGRMRETTSALECSLIALLRLEFLPV